MQYKLTSSSHQYHNALFDFQTFLILLVMTMIDKSTKLMTLTIFRHQFGIYLTNVSCIQVDDSNNLNSIRN